MNNSKPTKFTKPLVFAALACAWAASPFGAQAQDWLGGTMSYNTPANWNPAGIPTGNAANNISTNDVVLINDGDPVWSHWDTIAGGAAGTAGAFLQTGSTNNVGGWFRLAGGAGSTGVYTLSNGVLNCNNEVHIGEQGVGFLKIAGGTLNKSGSLFAMGDGDFFNGTEGTLEMVGGTINSAGEMWFGQANNGRVGTGHLIMHGGTINVNNWLVLGRFGAKGDAYMDGGTINKTGGGNVQLGVGTTTGPIGAEATFNQSGGTFNCNNEYQIATDNNLTIATNNISGTAVLNVGSWFAVGRFGGMGTLNLSGGSVTKTSNNGNVTLASGSSIGIINQTGGTFTNTMSATWIGENNVGIWNLSGGSVVLGVVYLSLNATPASGTFNLDGGDLTATEIRRGNTVSGNGVFNFNGGTLHAGGNSAAFMHDLTAANVLAGGAKINTEGYNVTISQPLVDGGGGGLTKSGNGTLTLSGVNTYTGPTVVNAGKLATTTANAATASYTVADGTGLGVTTLAANAQFSPASLTLGSAGATTLDFDLGLFGNPTAAPLNVVGNYAANGTVTVNIMDAYPQLGQFPLVKYGSQSGAATYVVGTLPIGVVATIIDNVGNNSIDLKITSVAVNRWEGLAGGNWDINITTNWIDVGSGLPGKYNDGSSVIFNDSALGTPVINLVSTVQPVSLSILNNATNFTLIGTGKISGKIGLNKEGTGVFTVANRNDFTGTAVVSAGTLVVSNLANGGDEGRRGD